MDIQLNQRYTDRPKNNDTLCTGAPLVKVYVHDNYPPRFCCHGNNHFLIFLLMSRLFHDLKSSGSKVSLHEGEKVKLSHSCGRTSCILLK